MFYRQNGNVSGSGLHLSRFTGKSSIFGTAYWPLAGVCLPITLLLPVKIRSLFAILAFAGVLALAACNSGSNNNGGNSGGGGTTNGSGGTTQHPDSLAGPNGPLPDSLVSHPDSAPKFDGFVWFFPHIKPSAIHLRQGSIAIDGGGAKPLAGYGIIPPRFVQAFLNRDSTRRHYFILRMVPDAGQTATDTVVRVIFADSLDFYLATFRSSGQLVTIHPLTRRGPDATGRVVEDQTYFYPRQKMFETFRVTNGTQRTVITGRYGQDGLVTQDSPANNSFFAMQDLFPLRPMPFKIEPNMDDCLSALEAMPRRLHPAFVVANWDTGYKPILIGQEFLYGTVYLPYARLYLPGGKVGLVVRTAEYRANSALNQFILFTYEPTGALIERTPIASVSIENTATMDKAMVESCELAPDFTLTLTKLLVRENINSGQHQERQSTRNFRITEQGRLVAM